MQSELINMRQKILITGGAGFIGSHLADRLIREGCRVRVLDNLSVQVHGNRQRVPEYLNKDVEFIRGDVRDEAAVGRSLKGINTVFHFAAAVGVGQSMYRIDEYTSVNNLGTAVLLKSLLAHPVEKLVVASSMSIYGEGLYRNQAGELVQTGERDLEQLKRGIWEASDAQSNPLEPVATPENKTPALASVYALSKYDQERMCLMMGRTYGIPTIALRFFNVYGSRQSLSNPYTGVLAIFASRYLNDKPPLIFEDGQQRRDFVSVNDVAQACLLALRSSKVDVGVFNIGSGRSLTILEVAEALAKAMGKEDLKPVITGKYRIGDIRHCFADITTAQAVLGYRPRITFEEGLTELSDWLEGKAAEDRVEIAAAELAVRGLTL